jgi:hypothetical protein
MACQGVAAAWIGTRVLARPQGPRSQTNGKGAHRPRDVLQALLAEVVEGEIELVAHLVAHNRADADAVRLRPPPGSEIDAVAKMSPSSTMMSPWWMPTRNSMRFSAGTLALRSVIARCISTPSAPHRRR